MTPIIRAKAGRVTIPAIDALIGILVFIGSAMLLWPSIAFFAGSVGIAMIGQFFARSPRR